MSDKEIIRLSSDETAYWIDERFIRQNKKERTRDLKQLRRLERRATKNKTEASYIELFEYVLNTWAGPRSYLISALAHGLDYNPTSIYFQDAAVTLGEEFGKHGLDEETLALAELLSEQAESKHEVHYNAGLLYQLGGDPQAARSQYQLAARTARSEQDLHDAQAALEGLT